MNVYFLFKEDSPGKGGEEAEGMVFNKYAVQITLNACHLWDSRNTADGGKTDLNGGHTDCKRDGLLVRGQCS